jgi:hypothetical protein
MRRYAGTQPQGPAVRVHVNTAGNQQLPVISHASDGSFVIAFQNAGDVFARRFDRNGNPDGGEFQVETNGATFNSSPSVSHAADDSFAIAWSSGSLSDRDVLVRRFAQDGKPLGGEIAVSTTTAGHQRFSEIAHDGPSGFVVVWSGDDQDGDGSGVFGRHFAATGTALSSEFQANTFTTSDQRGPALAALLGRFLVAWYSEDQEAPEDPGGIYAQRFTTPHAVSALRSVGALALIGCILAAARLRLLRMKPRAWSRTPSKTGAGAL